MKKSSHKKSYGRSSPPGVAEAERAVPDRNRPLIGVVVCAPEGNGVSPHLISLLENVARGVQMGGGNVARFSLPGLVSAGTNGTEGQAYVFPRRDLLADEVECLAKATGLAGLVLVANRNDAVSGLLLGAARLNVPSVFLPAEGSSGGEPPSCGPGSAKILETTAGELVGRKSTDAGGWPAAARPSVPGGDYFAHAFSLLAEGMGLAWPMSSTAPTGSPEQMQIAHAAGQRVVDLVKQNFGPRRVLMINAFMNAIRLDAAFGGCSEAVVFLLALAHECGAKLSLDAFSDVGQKTPQVCLLEGENGHSLRNLHDAGGVPAVLAAFKGQWLPHSTISGRGINELAKSARVKDSRVLKTKAPYRKEGGLLVLRGNLAPQGALFRRPLDFPPKWTSFSGVARVFDSREAALKALLERKIKSGDLIVVRYEGPRGGPGLRPLALLGHLASAQGLSKSVALLTDGYWGAPMPSGLAVEMVTPEATEASTLSILKDGDRVDIDLMSRRINVHLTDTDMKVRLARWQAPAPRVRNGFLARYARAVGSVLEGAVLK